MDENYAHLLSFLLQNFSLFPNFSYPVNYFLRNFITSVGVLEVYCGHASLLVRSLRSDHK